MSTDTFVLYSTAHLSRDEYNGWLCQLNAVMKPDSSGAYDARLSKDTRHVWVSLLDEEWFEMDMAEFKDEPEVLANIRQLLGGEPKSAIVLDANNVRGSKILAVQFTALCAEHYPCVVYQAAGQVLFPAHEVLELRDAGMGFDGYTWETADPARSFSWLGPWLREEFGDSFEGQMFARPDTPEGRNKKQLGA
jgi:hypothetical protein